MILFLLIKLTYSIAPAIAAAAIGALASGANTVATGNMNKKSRKFQEKMFDKTNAYNTPLEQRKRLEAAGLNPNLVYGGSSGGTAGTASQPSKPDFQAPDFSGIGQAAQTGVMDYYNTKSIQAGTDVNEARADNIKQDTVNKGLDAVNKAISAGGGVIDYRQKKELYDNTIKTAEERLRNLSINTDYTSDKNSREERVTTETVSKLKQEIKNEKTRGQILSDEAIMKKLDRVLYQDYKLRPEDPFYYKIIGRIMQELNLKL